MAVPTLTTFATPGDVRVMLPGAALFLVNIFRHFERFRAGYDQQHLETALDSIRLKLGREAAEGVMSDALLVDNELRLRTSGRFQFRPDGSPSASTDEHTLVQLVAALQADRYRLAAESALALDILQSRTMLLLARRLALRLLDCGLDLAPVLVPIRTDTGAPHPERIAEGMRPALRLVEAADA